MRHPFSKLTFVDLRLHELLQETGRDGFDLNIMNDRESVEVGLAGWERFVGMRLMAGFHGSASRVVTLTYRFGRSLVP